MLELNFQELVETTKGEVVKSPKNYKGIKLSTDTRQIEKDSIFLALKGKSFNGNEYAKKAIEMGATTVIVDEVLFDVNELSEDIAVIKVEDGLKALGDIARFYRKKLGLKVVGVTGSVGKTSTKDIVTALLSGKYNVFKTRENFNNHIGVPLMVLELDSSYDIAVIEMGMNHMGEIDYLVNIANPDVAMITNIGTVHLEHLKTQDNILKAKMEITNLFGKENLLVVNGDDERLGNLDNLGFKLIKTGLSKDLSLKATDIKTDKLTSEFKVIDNGEEIDFSLQMAGIHNVSNFMLGYAIAKELGVTVEEMKKGLEENLDATGMRLELIKAHGYTVLNDCYNSSPEAARTSIDVFMTIEGKRHIAVLGTMKELGVKSESCHREVGEYAKAKNIDAIFVFGPETEFFKEGFGDNAFHFESKEDLINSLKSYIKEEDVILIKASRGLKFEEITKVLI
ncbi:MAG: UDP-N-acetylmuramoyl-tripeptide--D-alanyl-D-alanine ligase [Sarcina sp.]